MIKVKKKVLTLKELDKYNNNDSGKVREKFNVPDQALLMLLLTTDRVSIFDRIIGKIPGKGIILNFLSVFWKNFFRDIIPNDIVTDNDFLIAKYYGCTSVSRELQGRLCLVRRAEVIPFECIVRFIMDGSLLKEYKKQNRKASCIWGLSFPGGLRKGSLLKTPVFTPSTKAPVGQHDINISYGEMVELIGLWLDKHPKITGFTAETLAQLMKSTSLALSAMAKEHARRKGYILVDTKFEFGFIYDPLTKKYIFALIDEVLTPDSSRFRFKGKYRDKQVLRDYFEKILKWDKVSDPPVIPKKIKVTMITDYNDYQSAIPT